MRNRNLGVRAALAAASLVAACGGGDTGGTGGVGGVPNDGTGGVGGVPNAETFVGAYCCISHTMDCCSCWGKTLELSSGGTYVERSFVSTCCDINSSTETTGEWTLSADGDHITTTDSDGAIQHWTIQSDGGTTLETDGPPPKQLPKNEACTPFDIHALCGDPDIWC